MSERKPGWYHIKTGLGWECAEWDGLQWVIVGAIQSFSDKDFVEIGPRIPTPDEPKPPNLITRSNY